MKSLSISHTKKMKPGEKVTQSGITFERLSNLDGRWSINIMVDGQRIHRVIGLESAGVTLTQVQTFVEQVKTHAREERLNLPQGRKIALPFNKAADEYLKKLKEGNGKGMKMKESILKLQLVPFLSATPLSKITLHDIDRYKKARLESVKPATVNRELGVLSHLFTMAEEWKWIQARPVKIKLLPVELSRLIYLTGEQAGRLVEAASHDENPHIYPFVIIGLETGMRKNEILRIKREEIDVEKRTIFIPLAKAGKREQPITAGLADYLKRLLDSRKDDSPWLFPCSGSKTGHAVAIEKAFRRVVAAAGLPPEVCRHTLRHTAITHLVQAGVDLPTVARGSGHKTLAMIYRYTHANSEHLQSATDKLERRYSHTNKADTAENPV
jgi:integrase